MTSAALFMVAYFWLFASVHSLLADPRFKRWGRAAIGEGFDRWQRPAYNLLALFMSLPFLFIMIVLPDRTIYSVPPPWRWLMITGQFLAALGMLATLRQTGLYRFFGPGQLPRESGAGKSLDRLNATGQKERPDAKRVDTLVTEGYYRYVRHPLYVLAMIVLWLTPIMTESILAFNISASFYFYLGARHEEGSLQEEYPGQYDDYRKSVPMFLPKLR